MTTLPGLYGFFAPSSLGVVVKPGEAPRNTIRPTISGEALVGETVTGDRGAWETGGIDFAYQWLLNGAAVPGATGISFDIPADAGAKDLAFQVTASNAFGTTVGVSDSARIFGLTPTVSVKPVISGSPTVGATLTVDTGTWANNPTSYAYQWRRDGVDISGATQNSYLLVSADLATVITAAVTATNSFGPVQVETDPTATIAAAVSNAPVNSVAPAITGTASLGNVLAASQGTWTNTPTSYAFQWKRAGVNISGATGRLYRVATADVGSTLTCSVTATNLAGSATTATSATSTVADITALSALPATPKAIYSVVKVGSYAGSCIRVRRSSDGTEQDIGFAANGVCDVAAARTFMGSSSLTVAKWYDQSGNALDMTQTTTNAQPVFEVTYLHGNVIPSIRNTSTRWLDIPAGVTFTSNSASIFEVVESNVQPRTQYYFDFPSILQGFAYSGSSSNQMSYLGTQKTFSNTSKTIPTSSASILGWDVNGTTATVCRDGYTATATVASSGSAAGGTFGKASSVNFPQYQRAYFFVVYDAALSGGNRSTLFGQLRASFLTNAATPTVNYVLVGDSIVEGTGSADQRTITANLQDKLPSTWVCRNDGIQGRLQTSAGSAYADASATHNIALIEGGTNDIGQGVTGSALFTKLQTTVANSRSAGFSKVYAVTLLTRGEANLNVQIAAYNSLLRSSSGLVDGIVDWDAAYPNFGSDSTLSTDHLHPNAAAHGLLADVIYNDLVLDFF